eukprot:TRINITY_DN1553_c1_g2_i1.p1 TRINITY_DN1553_c1_g2~~TRINITY_DN1553_c1_g2_i1.p1  ORF type:complete len:1054 (+),score=191.69 TRINITY_DN1553_c1_g2_i1:69-3230(+)
MSRTSAPAHSQKTGSGLVWSPPQKLHNSKSLVFLDELPTTPPEEDGVFVLFARRVQDFFYELWERFDSFNIGDTMIAKITLLPDSPPRKIMNLLLAISIIYQCAVIPLRAVWGNDCLGILPLWLALDYFMDFIYFMDIWFNFITSYTQDGTGKLIADRKLIARRYIRKDFGLHALASFPLDFLVMNYGMEYLPWFRLNRILRVIQLSDLFSALEKGFGSAFLRISRLFFLMLLFAHWFGCIWFYIAKLEGLGEETWAYHADVVNSGTFTQYITSAYWALVVMTTVGFGDIVPITNTEKCFTIVTMITGVSIYATIFGNMATMIAQMDASATRYREKLDALHEYMRYRSLPQYLRKRILNYYDVIWSRHKGIDENAILNELPSSLRSEIALYLNRELVENVPLFKGTNEPGFINSLVVMLKPQVALAGDNIIRHGEIGREMYFLSRGEVEVVSGDGKTVFAVLKEGSYFGEIALLFAARRIATIRALGYCELLLLTKEDFDSVLNFFPTFAESMRGLARQKIEEEKRKRESEAAQSNQPPGAPQAPAGQAPGPNQTSASAGQQSGPSAATGNPPPPSPRNGRRTSFRSTSPRNGASQQSIQAARRESKDDARELRPTSSGYQRKVSVRGADLLSKGKDVNQSAPNAGIRGHNVAAAENSARPTSRGNDQGKEKPVKKEKDPNTHRPKACEEKQATTRIHEAAPATSNLAVPGDKEDIPRKNSEVMNDCKTSSNATSPKGENAEPMDVSTPTPPTAGSANETLDEKTDHLLPQPILRQELRSNPTLHLAHETGQEPIDKKTQETIMGPKLQKTAELMYSTHNDAIPPPTKEAYGEPNSANTSSQPQEGDTHPLSTVSNTHHTFSGPSTETQSAAKVSHATLQPATAAATLPTSVSQVSLGQISCAEGDDLEPSEEAFQRFDRGIHDVLRRESQGADTTQVSAASQESLHSTHGSESPLANRRKTRSSSIVSPSGDDRSPVLAAPAQTTAPAATSVDQAAIDMRHGGLRLMSITNEDVQLLGLEERSDALSTFPEEDEDHDSSPHDRESVTSPPTS